MRKVRSRIRRTTSGIFVLAAFATALEIVYLFSNVPIHYHYWFGMTIVAGFFLRLLFRAKFPPKKYINEDGYFVLTLGNELEHRQIAKQRLGRNLKPNEIIHHINGIKTDNEIGNLCLMDRQKHEFFHSWLNWTKRKTKRYPSINNQKQVLVKEYGGTLLEVVVPAKETPRYEPTRSAVIDHNKNEDKKETDKKDLSLPQKLSDELRKARKRLAAQRKIPVYMIFDNKTLRDLVETLPETLDMMLKVNGMGPTKSKMYGPYLIKVIKSVKTDFKNSKAKDSA